MIRVFQAADLPEAHLVAGLLGRAGIEARVLNEHAAGGLGDIPFGEAYPEVWIVNDHDFDRANDVLDEFEFAEPPGAMLCPACGEENPDNFDVCWKCQAVLNG